MENETLEKEEDIYWARYRASGRSEPASCGKWLVSTETEGDADRLCMEAAGLECVAETKRTTAMHPWHTDDNDWLCCIYTDAEDEDKIKKALGFLIKNGWVRRKRDGTLWNIAYKTDEQTRAGEYEGAYRESAQRRKLYDYADARTGELLNQ